MKKNGGLNGTINKIFGLVFGILVIGFSSYQTFYLLLHTSNNPVIAAIGLILFEGGMLFWLHTFQHGSQGLPQMAISLIVFILCLVGVIVANAIELGAVTLSLDSHLPNQLIVIAVIVHLIAKVTFPLVSPETSQKIGTKVLEGRILTKAQTMLDDKMAVVADDIANKMAETAKDALLLSIGYSDSAKSIRSLQPLPAAAVARGDGSADAEIVDASESKEGQKGEGFLG